MSKNKTHRITLPNGGRARVSSNISETGIAALCELTDALKRHMEKEGAALAQDSPNKTADGSLLVQENQTRQLMNRLFPSTAQMAPLCAKDVAELAAFGENEKPAE